MEHHDDDAVFYSPTPRRWRVISGSRKLVNGSRPMTYVVSVSVMSVPNKPVVVLFPGFLTQNLKTDSDRLFVSSVWFEISH